MNILTDIIEWRALRARLHDGSIGFVPTMGNLHEGHASLCRRSKQENTITVVSIFVNPTQFNEAKDFDTYPRTLEADTALLHSLGVDYLLTPTPKSLYPHDYTLQVHETQLSQVLEGAFRPGHFSGMLTIVLKLLNLVQPQRAYFGEKDYQQLLLVKKMVEDLFLSVEIIPCPTLRMDSGLALSSRNSRLSKKSQEKAAFFSKLLQSEETLQNIQAKLMEHGFKIDYVEEKWGRRLGAVWLDGVRLIDNVEINKHVAMS